MALASQSNQWEGGVRFAHRWEIEAATGFSTIRPRLETALQQVTIFFWPWPSPPSLPVTCSVHPGPQGWEGAGAKGGWMEVVAGRVPSPSSTPRDPGAVLRLRAL